MGLFSQKEKILWNQLKHFVHFKTEVFQVLFFRIIFSHKLLNYFKFLCKQIQMIVF